MKNSSAENAEPKISTTTTQTNKSRLENNRISARKSRQRRMAYILQLEMSLKSANEKIQALEKELRCVRAESIVTDGCMLSQVLLDPTQMGIYQD